MRSLMDLLGLKPRPDILRPLVGPRPIQTRTEPELVGTPPPLEYRIKRALGLEPLRPLAEKPVEKTFIRPEQNFDIIKKLSSEAENRYKGWLSGALTTETEPSVAGATAPQPVAPEPQGDTKKSEYENIMSKYFPQGVGKEALQIATNESGVNPNAISEPNRDGTRDWGIFQINDIHEGRIRKLFNVPDDWSKKQVMRLMLDPEKNIRVAAEIWNEQGWDPWSVAEGLGLTDKQKGLTR